MVPSIAATPVFTKRHWLAFGITFVVVFAVYCSTLSTNIDLESSGMYATAAMHGGVGCPPGYPQWTLVTWLFVHVIPVGNIAWRISLSNAMEGALASGLVALMGCKAAAVVIEQSTPNVPESDTRLIAQVSGCVGAMAFAFSTDFWGMAVTVDVQAFNILLFTVVLVLAMRWIFEPTQKLYLYAAFFFYGITITSGQSLISTSVGLQYLVAIGDRKLGRDLLLVNSTILLTGLLLKWFDWFPMLQSTVLGIYLIVTAITVLAAFLLIVLTRAAFTEWKSVLVACSLFVIATLTYLIVPILSMTNPPVNWAYSRTVEGFFHLLTRGQFEHLNPTWDFLRLLQQLKMYAGVVFSDFGWHYLPFAVGSLFVLKRTRATIRNWVIALCVIFVTTTVLMVDVMNPSIDRQTLGLLKTYFNSGYLILAMLTTIGMAAFIATLVKLEKKTDPQRVSN
jgi:hypothetical protein